ncbi:MAG TPA: hypothetical protein VE912_24715, partial [Bacteroidales bacterium]|nr:hypothetical protein [Bacteroidales bacterium]
YQHQLTGVIAKIIEKTLEVFKTSKVWWITRKKGTPSRIRTCNLQASMPVLYPVELPGRGFQALFLRKFIKHQSLNFNVCLLYIIKFKLQSLIKFVISSKFIFIKYYSIHMII